MPKSHTAHKVTQLNGVYYTDSEYFCRPIMELRLDTALPDKCRFLGASRDGNEWAFFAMGHYSGYDCEVFFATTGNGTPIRAVTRQMFRYIFDVCGCRRVTSRVDVTNTLAMRHNKVFGMRREGTLRQASPEGHDVAIFGMLKKEFRYGET